MKKLKLFLIMGVCCLSFTAQKTPIPKISDMHNTALQQEINSVEQVDFDAALQMAQKIWQQKQAVSYQSTLPYAESWQGKRVYDLINLALSRENQRLTSSANQSDSIIIPLTQMLVLLQNTTNADQDIREARLLFSQALMLEEIRLYRANLAK